MRDLVLTHPNLALSVLVRTPEQAAKLNTVHPTVTTIIGDFDSHDLLVSTAFDSDLVLHISGDYENGIVSLLEGIGKRPAGHRFFIHITGTANLIDPKLELGVLAPHRYSDVADYQTIMAFGPERWHTALEHKIIETSVENGVKTVILAPPMIFGRGSGTGSTSSYSFEYARAMMKRGRGFLIGSGSNIWSACSIDDVSSGIIFTLDEILKELEGDGKGRIEYGWDGYYFIEAGQSSLRHVVEIVLDELKKLGAIDNTEIDELTLEEAKKLHDKADLLFGTNSRSKAERLPALGWAPNDDWEQSLRETTRQDYLTFKEKKGPTMSWDSISYLDAENARSI